jgi:hypothetical protein
MAVRASGTHKSAKRGMIVEQILDALKSDEIFTTLDYKHKSESYIKQYMHQPLKRRLVEVHRQLAPGTSEETLKRRAGESLLWEGDVKTTVNHIRFLGAQHRPDFKVQIQGVDQTR